MTKKNTTQHNEQQEESILDILRILLSGLSRTAIIIIGIIAVVLIAAFALVYWMFNSDEELVDTVRHGFFGDDELVRIYTGTLRLGIDLAETEEGWIRTDGDTIRVLLPDIKLLDDHFLDEASARSFYETGKWSQADRQALANKARRKMLARCLTPANIASVEQNATAQFHQMLQSMGFPNVSIRFRH